MQHVGFSDLKHFIPVKSLVGGLDPNVAHEHVCAIHLEFFDAFLKKVKEKPSFVSDDVVRSTNQCEGALGDDSLGCLSLLCQK